MACGRTLLILAVIVGILSLLLQILGYSCPGWVVVCLNLAVVGSISGLSVQGYGDIESRLAVWYTYICIHGDGETTCRHESFHGSDHTGFRLTNTLNDIQDINWTEVEILLTLAIVFAIFGLILTVVGLYTNAKLMASIAAATWLMSWVLILSPIIKLGIAIQDTRSAVQTYEDNTGTDYIDIRTPWALILTAIGLVLAVICCVLLLIGACKLNEKTSGLITPESHGHTPESPRHTPTSSPSDDDLYTNPLSSISKIIMREETQPHMMPQYNNDLLPPIGSKDTASLGRPSFGLQGSDRSDSELKDSDRPDTGLKDSDRPDSVLNGYPDEPAIDYDSASLPRSTPPMDTSLHPSLDYSRQNTTMSSFKGEIETRDGKKITIDTYRPGEKGGNSGTQSDGKDNKPTGNGSIKVNNDKTIPTAQVKNVKQTSYQNRGQGDIIKGSDLDKSKVKPNVIQPLPTKGTKNSSTLKTSSPRKNKTGTGLELV